MSFPKLTFPIQVDFGQTGYWVGDRGPYKYGEAVTAFFAGDDLVRSLEGRAALMKNLEWTLQMFGGMLQPYVGEETYSVYSGLVIETEKEAANCSVCFAYHTVKGAADAFVERYLFHNLRDFLYVELCKAIQRGNAPRQCRLCEQWFLHEQGEKYMYCERPAPKEDGKTCREIGARTSFEQKIQEDDAWKIYKRAYKKYYARVMKNNMTRDAFDAWQAYAVKERKWAEEKLRKTVEYAERERLVEELKRRINAQ